jgi:hypothetical protein
MLAWIDSSFYIIFFYIKLPLYFLIAFFNHFYNKFVIPNSDANKIFFFFLIPLRPQIAWKKEEKHYSAKSKDRSSVRNHNFI